MEGCPHPDAHPIGETLAFWSARCKIAIAHLPGHTQNHRDAGPEEEDGEGCARCHAALTYRYHHGRLYARDSRERAISDQLDQS